MSDRLCQIRRVSGAGLVRWIGAMRIDGKVKNMNAIEKINAEMQKNADDLYTEIIGTYIIDRCNNDIVNAKVASKDKSLKGAMDAVMKVARTRKNGNCAVLAPAEVFGAVDTYFGIGTDFAAQQKALMLAAGGAAAPEMTQRIAEAPKAAVSLNLDDFI